MIESPRIVKIMLGICIALILGALIMGYNEGFDLTTFLILASLVCTATSAYLYLRKLSKD
ncbi:MAG: hypothetical protein COA80_05560 [Leeuwenhoekiella sp.]|nr:MAG: hypothetical protein COA80_05560 [Leeuwenhoekiella sp.]